MTQGQAVIKYLKEHKTITPFEAYEKLHITKLATVISDLRLHKGYHFKIDMVDVNTEYGKTIIAKYELAEEGNANG